MPVRFSWVSHANYYHLSSSFFQGATLLNAGLVCRYARSPQCPLENGGAPSANARAAASHGTKKVVLKEEGLGKAVLAFRADENLSSLATRLVHCLQHLVYYYILTLLVYINVFQIHLSHRHIYTKNASFFIEEPNGAQMCASNSFYYVYELPAAVGRRPLGPRYQKDDQNRYDLNSKRLISKAFCGQCF